MTQLPLLGLSPFRGKLPGQVSATRLSLWLGQCIECDVRSDGRLVVDHGDGYLCRSVVTEAHEPHRLAMTWEFPDEPESRIGIELRPSVAGTVVELAHHGLGDLVGSYGPRLDHAPDVS